MIIQHTIGASAQTNLCPLTITVNITYSILTCLSNTYLHYSLFLDNSDLAVSIRYGRFTKEKPGNFTFANKGEQLNLSSIKGLTNANPSDIEPEMHDISVLDDILLTLNAQQALVAASRL